MADIELLIKIPEEMYKWVNDVNKFFDDYGTSDFIDLVKNGTPLPKRHGDLKDQYEARLKENNELINDLEELRTMINKFAESYENRLKADMVAMFTEIQLEIEEIEMFTNTFGWELRAKTPEEIKKECSEIIQEKIDKLKEETEVKGDKP